MKYVLVLLVFFSGFVFAAPRDEPICQDPDIGTGPLHDTRSNSNNGVLEFDDLCEIEGIAVNNPIVVGDYFYVSVAASKMSAATLNDIEIDLLLDGSMASFPTGKIITFAKLIAPGYGKVARINLRKRAILPACVDCAVFEWVVIVDWFENNTLVQNDRFYFPADARVTLNYYRDSSASPAISGVQLVDISSAGNRTWNSLSPVESPALNTYQVGIINTFADIAAGDRIMFQFPSLDYDDIYQ